MAHRAARTIGNWRSSWLLAAEPDAHGGAAAPMGLWRRRVLAADAARRRHGPFGGVPHFGRRAGPRTRRRRKRPPHLFPEVMAPYSSRTLSIYSDPAGA